MTCSCSVIASAVACSHSVTASIVPCSHSVTAIAIPCSHSVMRVTTSHAERLTYGQTEPTYGTHERGIYRRVIDRAAVSACRGVATRGQLWCQAAYLIAKGWRRATTAIHVAFSGTEGLPPTCIGTRKRDWLTDQSTGSTARVALTESITPLTATAAWECSR